MLLVEKEGAEVVKLNLKACRLSFATHDEQTTSLHLRFSKEAKPNQKEAGADFVRGILRVATPDYELWDYVTKDCPDESIQIACSLVGKEESEKQRANYILGMVATILGDALGVATSRNAVACVESCEHCIYCCR